MSPRPARWIRGLAIALGVLAVLLVAALRFVPNALLRSDFVRSRINREPDRGWLEYDSASSTWPGSLRVRNLRYRDRDPKAEWVLQIDEADLTYSVAGLLRKEFRVTRLSGRGLAFRVRRRLEPRAAAPGSVARLPPIPGFADPPLLGPAGPYPPATGKEWTLRIEGITIDGVRELWIDEYRCLADGRLTGAFSLRPKHRAEVFFGRLAMQNGTLRSGRDVLAEDLRATFETRIAPWNPVEFRGSRMLRFVSGRVEANARLDDADVVNHLIGKPPGTRVERGSGRMSVAGAVTNGIAAGEIGYGSADAAVRFLEVAMRGRLDARVRLSGVNVRTWGGGRIEGGRVAMTKGIVIDENGPRPWWGRVDLGRGTFGPTTAALFTTDVTARAKDARPLLQVVEVDLPRWLERLLRLEEELSARASVRLGRSLVEIHRLAAQAGKLRIWGEYSARSEKRGTFLFDAGPLSIGVGVSGSDADVRVFGPRKWFHERTGWEP